MFKRMRHSVAWFVVDLCQGLIQLIAVTYYTFRFPRWTPRRPKLNAFVPEPSTPPP